MQPLSEEMVLNSILKSFRKSHVSSTLSLPLKLRFLFRDRGHLGAEGSHKICVEIHVWRCWINQSHSATLAPFYNSPKQDLGAEVLESYKKMELDSDPDLNFLVVACLPSVCIWMSLRI